MRREDLMHVNTGAYNILDHVAEKDDMSEVLSRPFSGLDFEKSRAIGFKHLKVSRSDF
jgi:hypothetical protein